MVIAALLLVLGLLLSIPQIIRQPREFAHLQDRQMTVVAVADTRLQVEIVKTQESIVQGLSGRREIGADGMLFLLPQRTTAVFWMKDMLFDLDMVWLDGGNVVAITDRVPKPDVDTRLQDLPTYSPGKPVDMVLELPAGKAAELGIQVGSKLVRK